MDNQTDACFSSANRKIPLLIPKYFINENKVICGIYLITSQKNTKKHKITYDVLKNNNLEYLIEFTNISLKIYNKLIEILNFCKTNGYFPRQNYEIEMTLAIDFENIKQLKNKKLIKPKSLEILKEIETFLK